MVYLPDPYFFRKMATKKCTKCEEEKPLLAFSKKSNTSDGLEFRCRECRKAQENERRKDPDYRKRRKERRQTEEAKKKRRISANARGKTPWEKLKHKFATRLRDFVIRGKDTLLNRDTMGCTRAEMRTHIEDQFDDSMSWDNYGDWEFDHIVPYKAFPTVEELKKHHKIVCWYKNVRPLLVPENRGEGNADFKPEDKKALIRRFQLWEIEREVLALI